MADAETYSVATSGECLDGFELAQVVEAFAALVKISPEKAGEIVARGRVIKRELEADAAQRYKKKLESIGVGVVVEPALVLAAESPQPSGLSLEPIAERQAPGAAEEQASEKAVSSPSFGTEQRPPEPAGKPEGTEPAQVTASADALSLKAVAAAVVVALLGAWLWKGIALAFEYELGIIAWGIGGAIGMVAAMMGARGQAVGMVCGVLALVAILAGKYMVIESFQAQWVDMMAATSEYMEENLQGIYDEELAFARAYVDTVQSDEDARMFMVEYGYSEEMEAELVSEEELQGFYREEVPQLQELAVTDPGAERWLQDMQAQVSDVSTVELLKESFGLMDGLFLLLGVATAFRLGRGEE